jgi:pyruvate/2-oxoglutarate dehydrogenase complex dihydrolipoamide acyltransferase (E2) component
MGTAIPTSPKRGPRVRESVRDGEIGRDAQYDLLTAALIGAAIGATATLLLRRGPSGTRPVTPVLRGAKWAGRGAMAASAAGARWAREHGEELIDQIPTERIEREVRETVGEARDRINGLVQHELRDLRKAIRRQRRRLGV